MAVVYKYPLVVTDRQLVTMPKEAKILYIFFRKGNLFRLPTKLCEGKQKM